MSKLNKTQVRILQKMELGCIMLFHRQMAFYHWAKGRGSIDHKAIAGLVDSGCIDVLADGNCKLTEKGKMEVIQIAG